MPARRPWPVAALHILRMDWSRQAAFQIATVDRATAAYTAHFGPITERHLVDIGCGRACPATRLFAARGVRAIGVDSDLVAAAGVWQRLFRTAFVDRRLGKALRRRAGPLPGPDGVARVTGDAAALPFPDTSVDLIFSCSAFEHLPDVAEAAREIARVLVSGGVAFLSIHHWASLSGAHPWEYARIYPRFSRRIAPWDHLRRAGHEPPVFLNRLRAGDYRTIFERTAGLDIVEWSWQDPHGGALLTAELAAALGDCGEAELTHTNLTVTLRRFER